MLRRVDKRDEIVMNSGRRPFGTNAGVVQKCSRHFCTGSPRAGSRSVQLAVPAVEPWSRLLIPPGGCNMRKKSPYASTSSFLNMAVREGLTRFARPEGQPARRLAVCPAGDASCRTLVEASHPSRRVQYAKKKPVRKYELFLKYGGEGGIRTLDTLPYTHFPGVLLQPLGHLTILFRCTPWAGNGAVL